MAEGKLTRALCIARRPEIVRRSLFVALIVGTILNLINQGEMMWDFSALNLWKCALTYAVPYLVATYGSVMSLLQVDDDQ